MKKNFAILLTATVIIASTNLTTSAQQQAPPAVTGSVQETKVEVNALLNPGNPLGIVASEKAIDKTYKLIQQNKLVEARLVILPTVEWLTTATEQHTNLYKTLKEIDTAKVQADLERELALKFAVLRDQAIYQLALLYIEEKKPQKAVEKLVNVVRSQPKTQLGFSAYQVLQQIGFTSKVQLPKIEASESNDASAKNDKSK